MKTIEYKILDVLNEDYASVWEIIATVKREMPNREEEKAIDIVFNALQHLLSDKLITIYQGVHFNNDEEEVIDFILTKNFIVEHENDWKIKEYKDQEYKFAITEKGMKVYMG